MAPISVSRRSITKCLCRALNVPLSNHLWASLQQTLQPAQSCPGHQGHVQKPSGRAAEKPRAGRWCWASMEGAGSSVSSSDPAQQHPRGLIKGKFCSALWDPHCCSVGLVSDPTRKDTTASSTGHGHRDETLRLEGERSKACPTEIRHKGKFHKHTQMISEGLYRENPNPKHHRKGQKAQRYSPVPHWVQFATAVLWQEPAPSCSCFMQSSHLGSFLGDI